MDMKPASKTNVGQQVEKEAWVTRKSFAESRFFIAQHQTFSFLLAEAVSTGSVFDKNSYGNKILKSTAEIIDEFTSEKLTEFGKTLRSVMSGKKVIDLGCGDPRVSRIVPLVALALGARAYEGVDKELPDEFDGGNVPDIQKRNFKTKYTKDDMLTFLRELPGQNGVVFYLSGIEPIDQADSATKVYSDMVLAEIQRIVKKGDVVIIGLGTKGFDPKKYGFSHCLGVMRTDSGGNEYVYQVIYTKD